MDIKAYIDNIVSDIKYLEDLGLGADEILESVDTHRDIYGSYPVTDDMIIKAFKKCGYTVKF